MSKTMYYKYIKVDNMNDIIIKTSTDQDIPVILELLYKIGRPKPQKGADIFVELVKWYIEDPTKEIIIAKTNNDIIGMASMMFLPRLNHITPEMYIPELIVLQQYQNMGIGKKLISKCIKMAKEKNCHRIRLESGNKRVEAYGFYKHLGFEDNAASFSLNLDIP